MAYEGKLRVLPRGTAMVPHYEVQGSIRRFHGWKHSAQLGTGFEYKNLKGELVKLPPNGGFVKLEASDDAHVVELPVTAEYIRHVRDGDLWPADETTASICGRAFDPMFGGEHRLPSAIEALENRAKTLTTSIQAAKDAAKARAEAETKAIAAAEREQAAAADAWMAAKNAAAKEQLDADRKQKQTAESETAKPVGE